MAGGLEAETDVGTSYDDGLAGEGGLWNGNAEEELVVEEFEEKAHAGGCV